MYSEQTQITESIETFSKGHILTDFMIIEINLFGYWHTKGSRKIQPLSASFLGHEFQHLLNHINPKIANPDK